MFKARSGESVKLVDLLDEAERRAQTLVDQKSPDLPEARRRDIARAVGVGAIKYADLSKDRVGDYTFSFDQMLSMDGNTAPYLQYAYARIRSIFRKAAAAPSRNAEIRLEAPQELSVAKHLLRLGDVLQLVARELKPHYLTTFLYEVATKFSAFYEHCPVLQSEEPTRSSRLALCDVTARTLALGLDLLGIEHPEQM
jgi:arginyl-tRNA synthetase